MSLPLNSMFVCGTSHLLSGTLFLHLLKLCKGEMVILVGVPEKAIKVLLVLLLDSYRPISTFTHSKSPVEYPI